MLLVLIMGLAGRISRVNQRYLSQPVRQPWESRLIRLLQEDYANCRAIAQNGTELLLQGYMPPRSPRFLEPDDDGNLPGHIPLWVRYFVGFRDEQPVLFRQEIRPDKSPPDNQTVLQVATGIAAIVLVEKLDTDIAPPVLMVEIEFADGRPPIAANLLRFGGDRFDR
jgi:hypothetical protein